MMLRAVAMLALGLSAAAAAHGQTPTPRPADPAFRNFEAMRGQQPGANTDPLQGAFFAPELVMKHQQELGLSATQRSAIIRAIQEAQPRFIEAQWQLEPEAAALAELVKAPRMDEQRVLQQLDRVLELERMIKRTQIELMMKIKNQLTEEQQQRLARLNRSFSMFWQPDESVMGGALPVRR